ncbi:TetR/AcrR family transcriptional regulator [Mesorhizobium sp. BE184]|uniref:TetR/AcrR family transcriptional regulator n=1 Tax=Mesorhizobium sp. BE184 TaxID=2817714 RepID=UPI00286601B0|nr:TetR/AcrR family transcriptional regulator [Mesorhizobium sp. BE184]MDR7033080.1 AcrR family transcriptional regulator [Mesorhizobium sp. BE184]
MGRTKSISDDSALDSVLDLIAETGPAGLTFARAGQAARLSPATLVQRYGNRDALLEAALLRAWDRLDAETAAADAEEPLTPDGAIRILLRLMPPEAAEKNATDGLLLLREDIRNPVLRARGADWGTRLANILGRRLDAAPEGERLGWQMASVWLGAQTWWAFTRNGAPDVAIRQALEDWCGSALAKNRNAPR